jgi:hypothetical protein
MTSSPARLSALAWDDLVRRSRRALVALVARVRAPTLDSRLLLVLGVLLLAFLAALILEPGSVGRGGR